MRYNNRNINTLKELSPKTFEAAIKWYQYCLDNNIELLITDGIRTEAEQKALVARGASKTMKSYHLVGQAFDFVPIDSKGNALWTVSAYKTAPFKKAIAYAKTLGFEWGGDWKSFVDCPHMQFNYKGYGTDTYWIENEETAKDTYTVVAGDTLSKIALRNGVGIQKIKTLNKLTSDVITIGQVLKLKDPSPIMWGKTELRKGQIGKITVLKDINVWKDSPENKGEITHTRTLAKGGEFRVYSYRSEHGGQYYLGAGEWVTKMPEHIKYETPSKAMLAKLNE